ncbi:hypothetical protein, partial [Listeria monocytogenes]|uniref:hypothetical protein n=1 Tax=Listeria monocytogenes TaxID=1639 RepID=UPI002FDB9F68
AAEALAAALISNLSPHATSIIVHKLFPGMSVDAKWRTKQAALNMLTALTRIAAVQVGMCLSEIIPVVLGLMWDTKAEV